MSSEATDLDTFFPLPSSPPSTRSPSRLPGITRSSSDALIKVLKDNHVKWHAFFNDRGFHNHASHHLLAIYALGAGGPLIEEAYQTHVVYMRPAFKSPEPVNEKNFWKHVGKREFYNSYLEYFRSLLVKKDVTEVIEEYIFSAKANVGGPGVDGSPRLLNRFLASIVHPMIHTSCGLEFGILGLVAEGLAQSAVHPADAGPLIPPSLFQAHSTSVVARLTALLPSLTLRKGTVAKEGAFTNRKSTGAVVHAFSILARVLADDRFAPASLSLPVPEDGSNFAKVNAEVGDAIVAFAGEWAAELDGDGATADAVAKKIEELAWMNALIYGVGGWAGKHKTDNKFNADFFYMHLVTSTIFLPSLVAYLTPRSAALLLRTYFSVSLGWYVAQGRPALPIREFYAGTTPKPVQPGEPHTVPAKDTLTADDASPNPWLPIVQTTIVHPAEHLCKLQRALMHDATLYGTRAAGEFAGVTELEGAEVLDGTVFVRIAGLTADRIGWMREGQEAVNWDRCGFF
ncbi:hypothetical protein C8Q80DRAFT_1222014 [Daedaleopsis nitida]|nr:hypothetical protein C8Q80DRAFT_1222014 [Daedaleopsis nitida]